MIPGTSDEYILKEISRIISEKLSSVGMFFRIFSRIKHPHSITKKTKEKAQKYSSTKKKIQDVFALRVTVYFHDDEEIAIQLTKPLFTELPDDSSIDKVYKDTFGPQRCNLVFRIPNELIDRSLFLKSELTDTTFEVQFRTVLSEGWHEVEHDLRYKCQSDWDKEFDLSRQLNGLLATLETCNWSMLKIFEELAYRKFKEQHWSSFFRNILRIRVEDDQLSQEVQSFLSTKPGYAKQYFKIDRPKLISPLSQMTTKIPLKLDNIFFIINRAVFKDISVIELEPKVLKTVLDASFPIEQITVH